MKPSELRELSNQELKQKIEDCKEELFNLRFQRAANRLSNNQRFREVKTDVARINTILSERSRNQEVNNGK